MSHAVAAAPAGRASEDRTIVVPRHDGTVIGVADGAGGSGRGGVAAQHVVDMLHSCDVSSDWESLLFEADEYLLRLGGQTTAVILGVGSSSVTGASVGDSRAWLLRAGTMIDLTARQVRKPLLGDGGIPVAFTASLARLDRILVATDGLFAYAHPDDIVRLASGADLADCAEQLVRLVRLPNGSLHDDVALVLWECQ